MPTFATVIRTVVTIDKAAEGMPYIAMLEGIHTLYT